MSEIKLLLCCDLDRTIIPNGSQAEHPRARERFAALCCRPEISLVYVSGRHRELIDEAIDDYQLPRPDYAISDVGSRIYRDQAGTWCELDSWQQQIAARWQGQEPRQLRRALARVENLQLQDEAKQSRFKLSYQLPLSCDRQQLITAVGVELRRLGIASSLVWSIDQPAELALLDLLPKGVGKLQAIEYLQQQLGLDCEQLLFAGDSGNDLPVLASGIRAVLVANASDELRSEALLLARQRGQSEALFLAGDSGPLGGNYSAGVLQGLQHYEPQLYRALGLEED